MFQLRGGMLAERLPRESSEGVQLRELQRPLVPVGGAASPAEGRGVPNGPGNSRTSLYWWKHCRDWAGEQRRAEIIEFFWVQKGRLPYAEGGLD